MTGGLGNKKTSGDQPNNYIIEDGQNPEETPGDVRRLQISQTPDMKRWCKKTLKEYIKVPIIPIVIGALGTVTKGLAQGLDILEITG